MSLDVLEYYDALAPNYDHLRFANSYGQFIDYQEQRLLSAWLDGPADLDLAMRGDGNKSVCT